MTCSPIRFVVSSVGALVMSLAVATAASAGGQNNPGPAPSVTAIDSGVPAEPFHPSTHGPVAAPNHPPIGQVPPMPMPNNPNWGAARPANSGPGQGIVYNAATGQEVRGPLNPEAAAAAYTTGGGYPGADGGIGNEQMPASMGSMSLLSAATRAAFPYRMNVKLLMRFGNSYFVCSGSMRDANVVLTAGHCVQRHRRRLGRRDLGLPGVGRRRLALWPAVDCEPVRLGALDDDGSWTGWTVSGDFNFDIGAVAIDRAAGFLTGWFGWAYGGDCTFATTTNYNSASYPAESCSATLHTGADMYYLGGHVQQLPRTRTGSASTPPAAASARCGAA